MRNSSFKKGAISHIKIVGNITDNLIYSVLIFIRP